MARARRKSRGGTILPLLGVCLIGLFAFVAVAVDLGMLAVSRTQCQNAADVAALVGARTLDNKQPDNPSYDNNRPLAIDRSKAVITGSGSIPGNSHLSSYFTSGQITTVRAGVYDYDPATQRFAVTYPAAPPAGRSWTAMEIVLTTTQPTYFMRVFGVSSMPTGARAVAVHRPRDVAFALDMTGSMAFSSTFNFNNQSLNPDPLVPSFGHYTSVQNRLVATANQANGSGEAISRNNYTITTPGGPPIVRGYRFDPVNATNPTASAFPVTATTANLRNAFHRWSPPESGGNSDTYTAVTYDFTGYNAYHNGTEAVPKGPTPAPGTFGSMIDSGGITYVGDRYRRANGSINKTNASWDTGSISTRAAVHAAELLGYSSPPSGFNTSWLNFRDPVWETHGYDLDIVRYRTDRGSNGPLNPNTYAATLVPTADRFQGFSMGPGYWGKTFYIWPPDPRAANDWRRKFFLDRNGNAFNPANDNNSNTTGTGNIEGINEVLLNSGAGNTVSATTANYRINYPAILAWLKTGPQTVPPNLRAGRVLYYTSIPSDVDTNTGTTQEKLDKVFWREYIDFVVGGRYTGGGYLYGNGDSWSSSTRSILTSDLTTYQFSWEGSARKPYMRYTDSPNRPRLHMWFGPLSMMSFIADAKNNWQPGTCTEAQCWQLKAGMNSVLDDIRNNHPNDWVGLDLFSYSHHKDIRVALGQDFLSLKNALFYPRSLLTTIRAGNVTTELRPFDLSFNSVSSAEIPNANGSTDPNTGLAFAFNLLSPSASLPSNYGTIRGRRGAAKVVIFETDGVPNSYSSMTFNKAGFNSYYSGFGNAGNPGNGDATVMNAAYDVVKQIVQPMATTATGGLDSGLSLPNAPAKVYAIGFGDLFDTALAPGATFRPTAHQFLSNIGIHGNTLPPGTTTLPNYLVITGTYQQRIDTLKDCMERIFQSGVAVTLIE